MRIPQPIIQEDQGSEQGSKHHSEKGSQHNLGKNSEYKSKKISEKDSEKKAEKVSKDIKVEDVSTKVHTDESPFKNQLDEAWKQFDQHLRGQQGEKDVEMEKTFSTPQNTGESSFTERANEKVVATEEIEIISAFPSSEIVLKVE